MFKDNTLRRILFGKHNTMNKPGRVGAYDFPAKDKLDIHRQIKVAGDDGLVLFFLKEIEILENRIKILEAKKK